MYLTESMWLEPLGLNSLLEQEKSSAWNSDWHHRGVTGARIGTGRSVWCNFILQQLSLIYSLYKSCLFLNFPLLCLTHFLPPSVILFLLFLYSASGNHICFIGFLWASFSACVCLAHLLQEGLGSVHVSASMCIVGGGRYDQKLMQLYVYVFWATLCKFSWNTKY